MDSQKSQILSYRPCGWYYRQAIRKAETKKELQNLAMILLDELEDHRKAFREMGVWPPVKHDPVEATAPLLRQNHRK